MAPAMAQGAVFPRTSKSRCNESFDTHFRKASAKATSSFKADTLYKLRRQADDGVWIVRNG
ncbi:hypothetical protein CVCC1112_2664 [Paenarthrobacter nicotinovorans]|nr:hypothetical protein CVCC1112_2664 [Paenarthrobacter nicotinovorans]